MRVISLFNILLMGVVVTVGGCVVAFEPLSKSGNNLTLSRPEPPAQPANATQSPSIPGTTVREVHDETLARYHKCRAGYKPLPSDDRPKLGTVDASDKAKLSMALAAFIQKQDQYMADHQKKEDAAYAAWKADCADVLH